MGQRKPAKSGSSGTPLERRANAGQSQRLDCRPGRWRHKRSSPVELLDAAAMPGAAGAYSTSSGKIYLNRNWLCNATEEQVIAVLKEEFGHHLDALINAVDTPGDEGARFSQLLINGQQTSLGQNETEDDHGLININGDILRPICSNQRSNTRL